MSDVNEAGESLIQMTRLIMLFGEVDQRMERNQISRQKDRQTDRGGGYEMSERTKQKDKR